MATIFHEFEKDGILPSLSLFIMQKRSYLPLKWLLFIIYSYFVHNLFTFKFGKNY